MLEKPLIQLGPAIREIPDVVTPFRINGRLGVSAGNLERTDHAPGMSHRHDWILGSMEDPDGCA